jgi:hypothetical protein
MYVPVFGKPSILAKIGYIDDERVSFPMAYRIAHRRPALESDANEDRNCLLHEFFSSLLDQTESKIRRPKSLKKLIGSCLDLTSLLDSLMEKGSHRMAPR